MSLLAQLANKAILLDEVKDVVDTLGLRFAGTRTLAELLAGASSVHPPYAERIRAAHVQVLKLAENAISLSMGGNPRAAIETLVKHGSSTLSGKLIETAYLVLHRYAEKLTDVHELTELVQGLRRHSTHITRAALGEQKRQAGGLTWRTDGKSGKAPATPAPAPAS